MREAGQMAGSREMTVRNRIAASGFSSSEKLEHY